MSNETQYPEIKAGQCWVREDGRTIRVMAVAGEYVMARVKSRIPFVITVPEIWTRYKLNPMTPKKQKTKP